MQLFAQLLFLLFFELVSTSSHLLWTVHVYIGWRQLKARGARTLAFGLMYSVDGDTMRNEVSHDQACGLEGPECRLGWACTSQVFIRALWAVLLPLGREGK